MSSEEPECINLFDIMPICVNDKVEIVVRSTRAMITYRGLIREISNSALLLENRGHLVLVRLSEIKIIKKVSK